MVKVVYNILHKRIATVIFHLNAALVAQTLAELEVRCRGMCSDRSATGSSRTLSRTSFELTVDTAERRTTGRGKGEKGTGGGRRFRYIARYAIFARSWRERKRERGQAACRPLEFRRNSSRHNIRLDHRTNRVSWYPRAKLPEETAEIFVER